MLVCRHNAQRFCMEPFTPLRPPQFALRESDKMCLKGRIVNFCKWSIQEMVTLQISVSFTLSYDSQKLLTLEYPWQLLKNRRALLHVHTANLADSVVGFRGGGGATWRRGSSQGTSKTENSMDLGHYFCLS